MNIICEKCMMDPSHSFKKISEKNGVITYYTNPTKAKPYNDTTGLLEHYNNALNTIGDKKWRWIFDSEGFSLIYALEVQTGIGIAKLITGKFGDNLQEITIINSTWHIKSMLMALWPFLSEQVKQKIKILDDRAYSILEFV